MNYRREGLVHSGRGKSDGRFFLFVPIVFIIGLLVALVGVLPSFADASPETNCTVTGKDRVSNGSGGSNMRIYTEECGTLGVGDLWLVGQFDSADLYGSIEEGKVYQFEARGHRLPVLSVFPTIIEVNEVTAS